MMHMMCMTVMAVMAVAVGPYLRQVVSICDLVRGVIGDDGRGIVLRAAHEHAECSQGACMETMQWSE